MSPVMGCAKRGQGHACGASTAHKSLKGIDSSAKVLEFAGKSGKEITPLLVGLIVKAVFGA